MITLELSKETAQAFSKALQTKQEEARRAGADVIAKTVALIESRVTEKIAKESTNTGQLLQSVYKKANGLEGEIGATAAHAPYIEFGTKPHRPPFGPIYEWVWLKRKDFGIPDEAVWPVAKAIVDKIATYGTKERKPFTRSIEETKPDFERIAKQALAEVMRR